jgi:hypothetical protein
VTAPDGHEEGCQEDVQEDVEEEGEEGGEEEVKVAAPTPASSEPSPPFS